MKRVKFYVESPGLLPLVGRFAYGVSPWLAPAVLPYALVKNDVAGVVSVGLYAGLAYAWYGKESRKYLKKVHECFWGQFKNHLLARRLSKVIRETLENGGLVNRRKKEIRKFWTGEVERVVEVVEFPGVEIRMDEVNYYLRFRMLPGQRAKDWEARVDAFAQALGATLVKSKIDKGIVEVVLQYRAIESSVVPLNESGARKIQLGMGSGGPVYWEFDGLPHMLVVGVAGAGKSTFLRCILAQMGKDWTVRIVDGKQVEFAGLARLGFDVVYEKDDFLRYVDEAYDEMNRRYALMRQKGVNEYTEAGLKPYVLLVDEFISLVESTRSRAKKGEGKSERERLFETLNSIATKGRAAGIQMILVLHRPDAAFIPTLVRDNCACKVVLRGSETAFEMAFGTENKRLTPLPKGQGYCQLGEEILTFSYPNYVMADFLRDMAAKWGKEFVRKGAEVLRFPGERRAN
jgi:hypothetical protein